MVVIAVLCCGNVSVEGVVLSLFFVGTGFWCVGSY